MEQKETMLDTMQRLHNGIKIVPGSNKETGKKQAKKTAKSKRKAAKESKRKNRRY